MFNDRSLLHNDFRVYIEGVQVPFESAHITSILDSLPTATITLPPWPGMQELGRNYCPKVNIFWKDYNQALPEAHAAANPEEYMDGYKLIYSGVIIANSDSKHVDPGCGTQAFSVNCAHPISALREVMIRFANQHISAQMSNVDVVADGSTRSSQYDINTLMLKALQGADPSRSGVNNMDKDLWGRLKGTPSMVYVLWNAIKADAKRFQGEGDSEILTDLYIPLIDEGLKFWARATGMPMVEEGITDDDSRVEVTNETFTIDGDGNKKGTHIGKHKLMVPSAFRSFVGAAAQVEVAVAAMQSLRSGMGAPESSSFYDHMMTLLERLDYQFLVLSNPARRKDGSQTEYIIKPKTPYWYAPTCNVLLPNLVTDVSIHNDFSRVPSRATNVSNMMLGPDGQSGTPYLQYTAPHSVRYARAGGTTLARSLSPNNNKYGIYEAGCGVKATSHQLPYMYNIMRSYMDTKVAYQNVKDKTLGGSDYAAAEAAWNKMYPNAVSFNPYSAESQVSAFNRLNFLYSDMLFATEIARARSAQVSSIFNPFPIVGLPMDVVDPVPSRESYHGVCTNASHTIHASGQAVSNFGMTSISSYTELATYNQPAITPYLMSAFDLTEDSRIYKNPAAYKRASQIYYEILGVGAAEPGLLQDYDSGTMQEFTKDSNTGLWVTDVKSDLQDSVQGSLLLVSRNLVSLLDLQNERVSELGKDQGFISIDDWIDVKHDNISWEEPNPTRFVEFNADGSKISTTGRDTESSPFLDYKEV